MDLFEYSQQKQNEESIKIWTVSELNRVVKEVLEQTFYPFWIRGEVSNLTIHRSGHVYMSLKDERSQVSAVFFRGGQVARELKLREGMEVEAWGRLGVYEPRGAYQVIVERLRPCGVGALQQRYEALKKKLRDEGLFDSARKRSVPSLPGCVGVVTSPQGAALHDFLQVLGRRFATMHVRVYPAAVQGERAAGQIAAGIRYFNQTRSCDVIVVTRGGGSLEDLWAFNEEVVAREVAASEIPVISAVGHEVDFTICDEVADLRVPTPSAAAELVTGRKTEMLERLLNLRRRLRDRLLLDLTEKRRRVERAAGHPVFREPGRLVQLYQQRVDELGLRLGRALQARGDHQRHRLDSLVGRLQALNPRSVLERGYSILINKDNDEVVTRSDQVGSGQLLEAVLSEGRLAVRVE